MEEAEKRLPVDPNRVYLAAQGGSVSTLFYMAARMPDLWAAAVAAGGSPRGAIDSNRLFAANTADLPVLWLFANKDEEPLGKKLQSAGFNLEWREPAAAKPAEIFDWLVATGAIRSPPPRIAKPAARCSRIAIGWRSPSSIPPSETTCWIPRACNRSDRAPDWPSAHSGTAR